MSLIYSDIDLAWKCVTSALKDGYTLFEKLDDDAWDSIVPKITDAQLFQEANCFVKDNLLCGSHYVMLGNILYLTRTSEDRSRHILDIISKKKFREKSRFSVKKAGSAARLYVTLKNAEVFLYNYNINEFTFKMDNKWLMSSKAIYIICEVLYAKVKIKVATNVHNNNQNETVQSYIYPTINKIPIAFNYKKYNLKKDGTLTRNKMDKLTKIFCKLKILKKEKNYLADPQLQNEMDPYTRSNTPDQDQVVEQVKFENVESREVKLDKEKSTYVKFEKEEYGRMKREEGEFGDAKLKEDKSGNIKLEEIILRCRDDMWRGEDIKIKELVSGEVKPVNFKQVEEKQANVEAEVKNRSYPSYCIVM